MSRGFGGADPDWFFGEGTVRPAKHGLDLSRIVAETGDASAWTSVWLRGQDLNLGPLGDENVLAIFAAFRTVPSCSLSHFLFSVYPFLAMELLKEFKARSR